MNSTSRDARETCRAEPRPLVTDEGARRATTSALRTLEIACVLTTAVIALTAGDMGPFTPLLVALGFYLLTFAAAVEVQLSGRALLRWVRLRQVQDTHGGEASTGEHGRGNA